ncbi:MAG: SUMF1/EgtB/PvdO family nonheme iron enzyme [Candidatus Sericytochromatia bacterium]|nr:SUMF1/EgtB/PvdO family nonheme iron enzyme [Candidatus Sericytochromatia bacterium]
MPLQTTLQQDKYRITGYLGRGGFGLTYAAEQVLLQQQVAIKEFYPDDKCYRLGDRQQIGSATLHQDSFAQDLQRFLREGQILAGLNHPHIVRVLDLFKENGTAYLVMEYLPGQTLKGWHEQQGGALAPAVVQQLGAQLVDALAALHTRGIYHLDLKPDNIVLKGQQPVLIDFGSAKTRQARTQTRYSYTEAYAAPELLMPQASHKPGAATDIYALAVVLYELLRGERPPDVLHRALHAPHWQADGLPAPWQTLLNSALQLQPEQRPQDVARWWAGAFGTPESEVEQLRRELAAAQTRLRNPSALTPAPASQSQAVPAQVKAATMPATFSNTLGMAFVLIQPGSFMMGSPADEAERSGDEVLHKVTLTRPFYAQTSPVTQAQWQAVMGTNPSRFKGDDRPVERVSWEDCQAFIKKLNAQGLGTYRLPTEAEWEYACRAGTSTPFGIGNGKDLDSSQANFDGDYPYGKGEKEVYREETTPVKHFAPNAWGLYDMHGNVWEWCQDWYGKYPTHAVTDPEGPETGSDRVARGGSWYFGASYARSASRLNAAPDYRGYLGFRLVRRP